MKVVYACLLLLFVNLPTGTAQVDSTENPVTRIDRCRRLLLNAFERDDRPDTQFWLDSLQRLESPEYLALQWDERWLLYIWLENYGSLFQEAGGFFTNEIEQAFYKVQPSPDSLFKRLDTRLFENNAYLFDQIRKAWLTTEERAFATLTLDYLLRLSLEEPEASEFDARLTNFLKQFPNSRFKPFIEYRMYNKTPPGNWALGFDLLLAQSSWTGGLERSLRPMFGVDLGLHYWRLRWNTGLRLVFGGQKLDRDVFQSNFSWLKDDPSRFFTVELETGYDVFNKTRLRIYPVVGGGFSSIHPPEDEEDPNPSYYELFRFNGWHLTTAIHADVKFNPGEDNVATTYHGVRIRLGHRWLNLSEGNPGMQGNMFFVSVGYTVFGRQPKL